MLEYLGDRASPRKLRLYACAWAYDLWHRMTDERSRTAVVIAERFANGLAEPSDLVSAFKAAQQAWKAVRVDVTGRHSKRLKSPKGSRTAWAAAEAARNAADPEWGFRKARHAAWRETPARLFALAAILRELFGNPFRPTALDPGLLAWHDGLVRSMAQHIHDGRPFGELPVLADALEEAGCQDAEILRHLRGPGPHSCGCWALDQALGWT
jgi:hypothetical protein